MIATRTMQSAPVTIAAVSSPPGRSARGLIRISGPQTQAALEQLLVAVPDATRRFMTVRLKSPAIPALLLRFTAPHSYTGEDSAELQLPGNAALLDRVLHHAIDRLPGVRLAEPGEFTFRAYTAGKLDLTQAEGIAATISATSDSQLRAATLLREGKLGRVAESLVDTLGNALALVEAGIDFTDQEDVVPIAPKQLLERIDAVLAELDAVLSRSRSWGAIDAPPRVVLVGPPSAGKSTLFNALLGHERAVIDPTPGTTRDALAEPLSLQTSTGEVEVMLVDIAGLDAALAESASLPDNQAQAAAQAAIQRADLILKVTDGAAPFTVDLPTDTPHLTIHTKTDLKTTTPQPPQPSPGCCEAITGDPPPPNPPPPLKVSATTGQGLDALKTAIAQCLGDLAVSISADMLALQPRHESALQSAKSELTETRDLLAPFADHHALPDIELLATTLRSALDTLAGLGGRLTPDEVIGRVFATFCVGK